MEYRYDAFISFAWRDLRRARRLHERLSAAGYVTWYAEQNLRGGSDLPKELWHGLEMSRYVFVVHSVHYAAGAWAERELSVATSDEINSRLTKIVFVKYDDTLVPYGMRQKLYIDYRNKKEQPFEQLKRLLDQASDGVIRGVAAAMASANDINAVRADAARLSAMARLRNEALAIEELTAIALNTAISRHASDSAAWAIGDVALGDTSIPIAAKARDAIELCVAKGNARIIGHMAWIAGEIVLGARNPDMRIWAAELIKRGEASDDPDTRKDFTFTRQRVSNQFRTP